MKKHTTEIAKMTIEDLRNKSVKIRQEINDLRKGIRMNDVQNYRLVSIRRKELARVLTLMHQIERKES